MTQSRKKPIDKNSNSEPVSAPNTKAEQPNIPEPAEPITAAEATQPSKSEPATPQPVPPRRIRVGGVLWGLLFIVIGGLLLLDNLGIISVTFSNLWQLWPLLIVIAGASMLSLRGWAAGLLAVTLGLAIIALIIITAVDNPYLNLTSNVQTQTHRSSVEDTPQNIEKMNVDVKAGAADITLSSSSNRKGVEAVLESSHMTLKRTSQIDGRTQFVTFSTESTDRLWVGNIKNKLSLDYNRSVPLALHFDIGAASLRGDLSETKLRTLGVESGASSIDLKLGSVLQWQDITLNNGASSVKLAIPKEVGVRVYADEGLSSFDFADVDKQANGFYESSGYDSAKSKIIIRADIGASSFKISRY